MGVLFWMQYAQLWTLDLLSIIIGRTLETAVLCGAACLLVAIVLDFLATIEVAASLSRLRRTLLFARTAAISCIAVLFFFIASVAFVGRLHG